MLWLYIALYALAGLIAVFISVYCTDLEPNDPTIIFVFSLWPVTILASWIWLVAQTAKKLKDR